MQYNLVPAEGGDLIRWKSNCEPGGKYGNFSLPPGLWLMSAADWLPRNRDQLQAERS